MQITNTIAKYIMKIVEKYISEYLFYTHSTLPHHGNDPSCAALGTVGTGKTSFVNAVTGS